MKKNTPQITNELAQSHIHQYLMTRNPEMDASLIAKAIGFSINAHSQQFRKSGMPYAEHPIEVAKILADLKLDTQTVIAGLLHDVVEDTSIRLETIQSEFGAEVAFMVDAVTKISEIQAQSRQDQKAETYRKLFISMAKDPRVIMIKFADRLHNLRTLNYMPKEKTKRIAQETLDLYAPLAHRFGLYRFKSEMEDLSFKYVNPAAYKEIVDKFQSNRNQREKYILSVIRPLQMKFSLELLESTMQGRPKHLYSIYQKMLRRQCEFEELFDLFAVRIIVQTIRDCYVALGYVHNLWSPLQSRFKDYIASPKSNLYQSLHTSVVGPEGRIVEIQIRTLEMDETSERGFAAHWTYKKNMAAAGKYELNWLDKMVKAQDEITDSDELLDFLRVDLKPSEMLVFTPKGDAISLPQGATVLDFAFAVHTNLGYQCIGAKIDNQFVNPDRVLSYGSTVKVIRSPNQLPASDWLEMVKTNKARTAIIKYNRSAALAQSTVLGREIYHRELRLMQVDPKLKPDEAKICESFRVSSFDEFLSKIGIGEISPRHIDQFLEAYLSKSDSRLKNGGRKFFRFGKKEPDALKIGPDQNLMVHFGLCCNPSLNDKIAGLLGKGQGIEIHRIDCAQLKTSSSSDRIPVEWNEESTQGFDVKIEIQAIDRNHLLEDITHIISKQNISIVKATIVTHKNMVRNRFQLKVFNLSLVNNLVRSLKEIPGVRAVKRL
jgi:GTP pyrophosphokinase